MAPARSARSEAFQRLERAEDPSLSRAVPAGTGGVALWGCAGTRSAPAVSSESFRAVLIVFLLLPNPPKLSRPAESECRLHACLLLLGKPLSGEYTQVAASFQKSRQGGVSASENPMAAAVSRGMQESGYSNHTVSRARGARDAREPPSSHLPLPVLPGELGFRFATLEKSNWRLRALPGRQGAVRAG